MDKSEIELRESYFCVIESEIKDYKEGGYSLRWHGYR